MTKETLNKANEILIRIENLKESLNALRNLDYNYPQDGFMVFKDNRSVMIYVPDFLTFTNWVAEEISKEIAQLEVDFLNL